MDKKNENAIKFKRKQKKSRNTEIVTIANDIRKLKIIQKKLNWR